MNSDDKQYIFQDYFGDQIIFQFYLDQLLIYHAAKYLKYQICYSDIKNFVVNERSLDVVLEFYGNIQYEKKDHNKTVCYIAICLEKRSDINYQNIIESNSPLKTQTTIMMEAYSKWQKKVNNDTVGKGIVYLTGFPRFADYDIDIDGFIYTNTRKAKKTDPNTICFELPFGNYQIHYSYKGAGTRISSPNYVPAQKSNDVGIELNQFNPQVVLIAKRGLFRLKLKLQ